MGAVTVKALTPEVRGPVSRRAGRCRGEGGGGVDAPLGEQGDFGGPDRDPVKEEVELVWPVARVLYELMPPQGWSFPLKNPFINPFAESLEFWGFVLLQILWANFGCLSVWMSESRSGLSLLSDPTAGRYCARLCAGELRRLLHANRKCLASLMKGLTTIS